MSEQPRQYELGQTVLSAEQEAHVVRLQHGIMMLDLFDSEVSVIDRREDFLRRTSRGTETRAQILAGDSYRGDEEALELAIQRAKSRYAIHDVQRHAMLEAACFLGIEATLKNNRVTADNPDEQSRLNNRYGELRKQFASRHRTEERGLYRDRLKSQIAKITGAPVEQSASDGATPSMELEADEAFPSVNVEERAVRLTRAINIMAWRSMLSGLNVAIPDPNYQEPIYDRYLEGTPGLDTNAGKKYRRLYDKLREDFWIASGFAEIRRSGIMNERLLQRRSQKMWLEFVGQFEHSPQQKHRVKVRKQLQAYVPESRLEETKDFHKRV